MRINRALGTVVVFFCFHLLLGCAGMDLRIDTMPVSNQFGALAPRVNPVNCQYFTKDTAPDPSSYIVLAQYTVQETPTVMVSRSPREMICYVRERAVAKGADTVIVDDMGTTNVAGGYARTSPVIKVRAIRMKEQPPSEW